MNAANDGNRRVLPDTVDVDLLAGDDAASPVKKLQKTGPDGKKKARNSKNDALFDHCVTLNMKAGLNSMKQ